MGTNARKRRIFIWQMVILCLLILLGIFGYRYFSRLIGDEGVVVRFAGADGVVSEPISLEIAANDADRTKGLMFRRELKPNTGMIFVFPREDRHSFWMRNTYVSLDMVFVNKERKVVGILEHVPVLNDEPRTIGAPSQYVIELPAGSASIQKISVGAEMKIDGTLPQGK